MKLYIQTRTVFKDYRYLGSEVVDDSWLQKYDRYTSFEHPTVIAESDDSGWRIFLGGLPSSRLDKVSTPIRYSFIIADNKPVENDNQARDAVLCFVKLCVQTISESNYQARSVVIQIMDDLYTNEEIEGFFNDTQNQATNDKNSPLSVEKLVNSINKFSENSQSVHIPDDSENSINEAQYRYLNINNPKSIENFIRVCSDIMAMEAKNNAALYLNFIEKEQDLTKVNLIEDGIYKFGFTILLDDSNISENEENIVKKKQKKSKLYPTSIPMATKQNTVEIIDKKKSNQTQLWIAALVVTVVGIIVILLII